MRHVIAWFVAMPLAACMAASSRTALPSKRIIAEIERGHRLLDNLAAAGAAHDAQIMNAEARVGVRDIHCNATGPGSATCSYETDRCAGLENDHDGDGWSVRTSNFVRVEHPTGFGDVIVDGWRLKFE